MAVYKCEECGTEFQKLSVLLKHRRVENHWKKYVCPSCKKVFNRQQNLDRHMRKHNDENNQHCPECLKVFTREDALDEHLHRKHGWEAPKRPGDDQQGGGAAKRQKLHNVEDSNNLYFIEKVSERSIEKFKTMATYYKLSVMEYQRFTQHFKNVEENIPIYPGCHNRPCFIIRSCTTFHGQSSVGLSK